MSTIYLFRLSVFSLSLSYSFFQFLFIYLFFHFHYLPLSVSLSFSLSVVLVLLTLMLSSLSHSLSLPYPLSIYLFLFFLLFSSQCWLHCLIDSWYYRRVNQFISNKFHHIRSIYCHTSDIISKRYCLDTRLPCWYVHAIAFKFCFSMDRGRRMRDQS